jgi:phenylacetate-coenzyme A ligase PaaK-like adenylate-forming protein
MTPPDFADWLEYEPYGLNAKQKSVALTGALSQLTHWHESQCPEYRRILNVIGTDQKKIQQLEEIPFMPVRLFKEFDLISVDRKAIFKTMTSSGTSGQQVSRIYLDRETASLQTKILSRLIGNVLGKKRLPMLIIDSPSILKDRLAFSARGAGVLGFSMFGQDVTYALDESMTLNVQAIEAFLERHPDGPVFIFGFTFMIWQYFVVPLKRQKLRLALDQGVLLHGGGWKKLQDQAVNNNYFKAALNEVAGIKKIVNYYGMVEQTGSLFMECDAGYLHAPVYADVIVRRAANFGVAEHGEEGILEVLSILPRSYPGHALLTEDVGVVLGEDDCPCGRLGKYFHVHGRLAMAEVRGCSDAHETLR